MSAAVGDGLVTMDATNLATLYDLPTLDWGAITAGLDAGFPQAPGSGGPNRHSSWLTTLDADGGPHVTGIGALWVDGTFWFETGERTRKGRNLARDPRCALSLATEKFDLVVRGTAEQVTDPATVARMAAHWAEDWPCRVDDSGTALTADFSAPSAGRPPWHVYRIVAESATALSIAPGGATTWRF
ncbi:pyridoxamine 5'-phosphate oxidase family protein [Pseudonocardia dioxanivorans]|uniref:pyridoxamine 5'-phosphate oxidase family protein n=1 Tax=Pseudonocardia dioxanivorans TaxID=240495 RepID=UPI0018F866E3|nr:pyridoxamine 5'-phosphate oxidase family protein [Pseudonocardia dioxanivorans]